jgi:hypothetical protein
MHEKDDMMGGPMPAPRDAAVAALDAVRADYAPRREPPTADEVRALDAINPTWGATVLRFRDGTQQIIGITSASCASWPRLATWLALGPDGPVSWSELAALVAGGGA